MIAVFLIALAAQTAPLTIASPELRMPLEEFRKLYARRQVLVLDVRGVDAYRAGHIPGAISLPLDVVEKKAAELKKERRTIVTYCS